MVTGDELLSRVHVHVREEIGAKPGVTLVAAVSGGPDSMALLHMLKHIAATEGYGLIAAHVNHRFRGEEADAEAELVRRTSAEWGIAFEAAEIDVPAYIAESGLNTQEAAREKRYGFLREVALRHGASFIALGHHADDQAETVLMRLLRGSGIGGLAGMAERRKDKEVELLRPLLRITKQALLAYNESHGVPYALDSSNADVHYFRNALRHDVIPLLERYNPQFKTSLVRLSDLAAADDAYMEDQAKAALAECTSRMGDGIEIEGEGFRAHHLALQRRMVKLILNGLAEPRSSANYEQVDAIVSVLGAALPAIARMDAGGGLVLIREYAFTYIGPALAAPTPFEYAVPDLSSLQIGEERTLRVAEAGMLFRFARESGSEARLTSSPYEAFFGEDSLALPLHIRSRRPGDAMEPLGVNGSKKVQDMFVDAKIPRSHRDRVPLLADASGRIVWIPGLRRSRHALQSPDAMFGIRILCEPDETKA